MGIKQKVRKFECEKNNFEQLDVPVWQNSAQPYWFYFPAAAIRDNFAKPHTLSLAYKASTFFDHGDPYMSIFKYMKNNK